MTSQFSSSFPSSPPHQTLSLSSHFPSSPTAHHQLSYYPYPFPAPVCPPSPSSSGSGGHSPPFNQAPPSPSAASRMQYAITAASGFPPKSPSPRLPSPHENSLANATRKLSISIPPLEQHAPAERFGVAFGIKVLLLFLVFNVQLLIFHREELVQVRVTVSTTNRYAFLIITII